MERKVKTLPIKKDNRPFTRVVFREWRSEYFGTIALFPDEPYSRNRELIMSYEHVGQHAGANYQGVLNATRASTREEFMPLFHELVSLGYRLRVVTRA